MNQQDFEPFSNLLDLVAEQYGKTMSEGLKMLYWQGLEAYDFLVVREAFSRHLRNTDTGMFMPKIADIVKMMKGSTQDTALLAWSKVDKAVRHVGTGQSVVFDDPLIHKVLEEMGGWVALGSKSENEWPFVAKEFENRYRGYKQRSERVVYSPVMIGRYEAENNQNGFKSDEPVLLGNTETALLVMKGGNKDKPKEIISLSEALRLIEKKDEVTA